MSELIILLKSVEGIYKDGKVELLEQPEALTETRVIVTFLPENESNTGTVNLRERGIDQAQAAELRWRLGAIAEDWNAPGMEAYDNL